MKWSEEDTLKFVELYRDHECLWNMTKIIYRNKNMRQKAVEDIMLAMGIPGFGVAEIKQKIKNIRSTYNHELQKIKKSSKSGTCPDDVYKPSVKWFHIMNQIMKVAKGPSETESNLDAEIARQGEVEQTENESGVVNEPDISGDEQSLTRPHTEDQTPKSQLDQSLQQARQKKLPNKEISKHQSGQPISSNATKPKKGTKRRLENLSDAVNELRNMNEILNQPEICMQENEAFGIYVTSALNKLSQTQAILAQNEIQGVVTRFRLNMIPEPSRSYLSPTTSNDTQLSYSSPTSVASPLSSPSVLNICGAYHNNEITEQAMISPSPSTSNIGSAYENEQVTDQVSISNIISQAWNGTYDEAQ